MVYLTGGDVGYNFRHPKTADWICSLDSGDHLSVMSIRGGHIFIGITGFILPICSIPQRRLLAPNSTLEPIL